MAALVDGYRAGAAMYELARQFKIHRARVSGHLHRLGVTIRRQGLTEQQADQTVKLYADGWSVPRIGRHVGVSGGTVWLALRARGVRMRDVHGHPRR